MAMVDVTVMGAGIFGLACAFACAERGAKVQVIDPGGPGAGASGGVVGALSPHTPENWNPKKAFQFESLILSRSFWPRIEALSNHPSGYGPVGRLQAIEADRALDLARDRAQNAQTLWRGLAEWRVVKATDHADWAPQSASGYLIHDTLSARMHPRMACHALAGAITALGGKIVPEAEPQGAVIWATGHQGLQQLSQILNRPVGNGVKGQAAVLALAMPEHPQLYADGLHIIPHVDGTVAIGSTSERDFDSPNGTDAQLDALIARARAALPALAQAPVLARWAGVRPRARSRAPMLGPWPGRPGHFIANGGFKIGFGMAPKVGQVMADLVLAQHDTIPQGFRIKDSL